MKSCLRCGTDFVPIKRGGARKWCSDRCRRAAWEARNRKPCIDCGQLTSRYNVKRCWECDMKHRDERRLERWAVIKALWDAGVSVKVMAMFPEVGRANDNALGVELDRMKKAGVDLPPRRPGWLGDYGFAGPPRKPTTDHKLVAQRLGSAVRAGKLTRPDRCERCGTIGYVDGHHHDYSKPLDVEWLCRTCHMALHREEQAAA